MGFTRDVKLELVTVMPAADHCRRAQLSGLLFGGGVFEILAHGHYGVRVSTGLPAVARHLLALLKPLRVDASLRTVDSAPIGLRYEVLLGDEGRDLQVLNELGVLSDELTVQMTVPRRLVERRCCLVAFLRGLFLGCGSMSAPGAPVHAEFTVEDESFAEQVQRLLARLDLPFSLTVRERNVACYTKRGQTAADLLAVIGAHDSCLRWEEHAVLGTRARERQPARQLRRGQRAPRGGRRQAAGRPDARAHGVAGVGRTAGAAPRSRRAARRVSLPEPHGAGGHRPTRRSAARRSTTACAGSPPWRTSALRLTHMLRAARMVSSPSRYV